ncbi:MAG: hypothetical protein ACE5I1_23180 [bacterium]
MSNKLFGIVLILIALFIAVDTIVDISEAGFTTRDALILAVALFITVRGVMRFLKS